MSVEQVAVRPDGKITLPLLNDVQAAGLTPDQLREAVQKAASQFVEDANATIVVRMISSRRFFVTGGSQARPLSARGPMTVLQALAMAGGTAEFAKTDKIIIMRTTAEERDVQVQLQGRVEGARTCSRTSCCGPATILVP
jgi:polysaccharide export outer membrane protein